ncbi:MAG: hypothetical protein JNK44_05335 [Cyclobacteriaceae bacterium]|nr:hypothetical protein [Cyclobacteriaceae bacterium]
MEKLRFFKLFLFASLILVMTNCEDEDISTTGELSVSFTNHRQDIYVMIFSIENTEIPIDVFQLDHNGKAKRNLNSGNYYITVSSATYFASIGFQIRANSTTTIVWGADNSAKVQ